MSWQLILDTSTMRPAVCVAEAGKPRAFWLGSPEQHHSQILLKGIDESLQSAGVGLAEINSIAVGTGPGMFTGLRIGIATSKFLADLHGWEIVPFSSLFAQALSAPEHERVWAVSDARSKRVYALCVSLRDPLQNPPENEEHAFEPQDLLARLEAGDALFGEGAALYQSIWPAKVQLIPEGEGYFRPAALAQLGHALFLAKRTVSALDLQPRYLKTGQAHLP